MKRTQNLFKIVIILFINTIITGTLIAQKVKYNTKKATDINLEFQQAGNITNLQLAVLLTPYGNSINEEFPLVEAFLNNKNNKTSTQNKKGLWAWYTTETSDFPENGKITINKNNWKGKAELYLICREKQNSEKVLVKTNQEIKEETLPPKPYNKGEKNNTIKIGEIEIN